VSSRLANSGSVISSSRTRRRNNASRWNGSSRRPARLSLARLSQVPQPGRPA
jgi:hypothetical protein